MKKKRFKKNWKKKKSAVRSILGNSHLCKLRVNSLVARVYLLYRGMSLHGACGSVTPLGDSTRINKTILCNHHVCARKQQRESHIMGGVKFGRHVALFLCTNSRESKMYMT